MPGYVKPLHLSKPRGRGMKLVDAVHDAAELMGYPLQRWQSEAARSLMRFKGGKPEFPDILVSIGRQNGKTHLAKAYVHAWAELFPGSNCVWVAQGLMDARDRVIELGDALLAAGVPVEMRMAMTRTTITWPNGSVLWAAAPSEKAIHGASLDLVIADEVWALPERVLGSIIPARSARPNSQMLFISTAGVEGQSPVFERFRDLGRDPEGPVGIAEWACPEDVDPFDPANWPEFVVAWDEPWFNKRGIQQSLETLAPFDFRRYMANQWTTQTEELIPAELWEAARLDTAERGVPVLAFDANESIVGASVAASWPYGDDKWHMELVDWRPGDNLMWLVDRIKELVMVHRPVAVCGAGGGIRGIEAEIRQWCQDAGVPYKSAINQDLIGGWQLVNDGMRTGNVTYTWALPLETAVSKAERKVTDAGTKLDKRQSVADVTPLTACSLALLTAREYAQQQPVFIRGGKR